MSYTSKSILSKNTALKQVREVIQLLGYKKTTDNYKIQNRTDSMIWIGEEDYQSWVGIELSIYKEDGQITIETRSRLGRSYWDLMHQNKTIKILRDLFGGYFETDAGKNRYWRPNKKPPSLIMSGCFLARWRFNNALIKPRLYLNQRGLNQPNAKPELTGFDFIDEMNPRLFSNNLLLPYLTGIWEEYLKSTFIVLLKYSKNRKHVLNKAKLSKSFLESIASGEQKVEEALAESLSFQRPKIICDNFKLINNKLDIASVLKKPYKRRKTSLFESINLCIDSRNELVHTGQINILLIDKNIEKIIDDFEVAVDRIYKLISEHYNFKPLQWYEGEKA
jgi:hypothetical protein